MTTAIDPDAPIPGLMWNYMAYRPEGAIDALAGPDQVTHCEAPRHQVAEGMSTFLGGMAGLAVVTAAPPAAWVEMLWYPKEGEFGTIARCWKTCASCHDAMVEDKRRNG